MHMMSKNTSKSGPKLDAKFHEGIWLGLRMKSDESIIGTSNGVMKAKTVRRLLQDERWRAEEVLNIRGISSNPVHIPNVTNGAGYSERGEDKHAPAQEREKCDTRSTVAASDPTVRRLYKGNGATEGCLGCKGIEAVRSMAHNNECRMRIRSRMEQSENGRDGLKKEEQRQDRHLEKAVMRSVSDDPELRRAEDEHRRTLVEIENDDGPRGSETEGEVMKRTKTTNQIET